MKLLLLVRYLQWSSSNNRLISICFVGIGSEGYEKQRRFEKICQKLLLDKGISRHNNDFIFY